MRLSTSMVSHRDINHNDRLLVRMCTQDFDGVMLDTANAWQEGSPFVTTCPIAPNASFTYELPLLPTQGQTL